MQIHVFVQPSVFMGHVSIKVVNKDHFCGKRHFLLLLDTNLLYFFTIPKKRRNESGENIKHFQQHPRSSVILTVVTFTTSFIADSPDSAYCFNSVSNP